MSIQKAGVHLNNGEQLVIELLTMPLSEWFQEVKQEGGIFTKDLMIPRESIAYIENLGVFEAEQDSADIADVVV
jgi:hypothetical protein